MTNVLKAIDISKSYNHRKVVDTLSLDLNQGEVVGIFGPNGAGKTTAFYIIAGLITPDDGNITLNDVDISADPMHIRAHKGIGYLPQEASIFQKLSVEQNIRVALEVSYKSREAIQTKLDEVLGELQLNEIKDQIGISLSGGERRRVEIARLLAIEPTFLLLDEPFAGVDPISVTDLQKLIIGFKKHNLGMLISDHNVQATLKICDRAYIVHHGKIIAQGTPQKILENDVVKNVYLGDEFRL